MYTILTKPRANSRRYTKAIAKFETIAEVLKYVQSKSLSWSAPYIFSHIELSDGSIISQTVIACGHEFMTSPESLRKALENK